MLLVLDTTLLTSRQLLELARFSGKQQLAETGPSGGIDTWGRGHHVCSLNFRD